MKTHATLAFLLICLNCILRAHAAQFAVLLATTKSWLNYGHQATVLHAYQTLIANGFPSDNIITMFYDDIANDKKNPEKGVLRNHPKGENLYENVKKDYIGRNVTADNFVGVITGDSSLATGPVIGSTGPKDTLFIYMVGFASFQYLTFPTGRGITARHLVDVLERLTRDRKFNKIFVSADVSFSAALFEGLLSPKSKVFVTTSTSSAEHPHAVYCIPETRTCHGSLFGVAWTEYSDRQRELRSGVKRTLYDQFNHVRTETPYTHVNIYGDLGIGRSALKEFLSYKHEGKRQRTASDSNVVGLETPVRFGFEDFTNHRTFDDNYDHMLDAEEKDSAIKHRNFMKETMRGIFDKLQVGGYEKIGYEKAGKNRYLLSAHHSDVYEKAILEFHQRCMDINENQTPFALREISKLAHLCENEVDLKDLISAMEKTCTAEHKLAFAVKN